MIRDSDHQLDLKLWTKQLVHRYGLRASKRLGQHFLIDRKVLSDIIAVAKLMPQARVLEVGGGLGVLTLELLKQAEKLVVVELDKKLIEALKKIGLGNPKLKVIQGDIIKIPSAELKTALSLVNQEIWQIVANIPYEITGAFLHRFLWGDFSPESMTLLVQREVGERLAASPGKMSLLSLACQLKSQVKILRQVPPLSFWPPPRVESSLVNLKLKTEPELKKFLGGVPIDKVWRLARLGFAARRKLLLNNLAAALPLTKFELEKVLAQAGIAAQARAQELSLAQWVTLTGLLAGRI